MCQLFYVNDPFFGALLTGLNLDNLDNNLKWKVEQEHKAFFEKVNKKPSDKMFWPIILLRHILRNIESIHKSTNIIIHSLSTKPPERF